MFQGYYNQQEEQCFPWQESENHGHHGHHGHHHGHHEQRGPQFEGPRGYGRGPRFGGPRGQWGGPRFEGPRGPWGPGFGGGRGFGGFGGGYGRPEFTPELQVLRSTAGEVIRLFFIAARSSMGNTERQGQLRSFLERARTELLGIIGESKTTDTRQESQQAEQPNVEQA